MNYTDLKSNIADVCENTFTDAMYKLFTQQAEQRIYASVQVPALRKNSTGTLTTSNQYLSVPSDYLYTYSLAVLNASSEFTYLVNKDVNFIRDAYPTVAASGLPKYYADFDVNSILLGPTPDSGYTVELHYGYYPESIVTASTTWLGDNFEIALLNGALVEAARFMKQEADIVQLYEGMYGQALLLLKNLGDGKLRGDTYRNGQPKSVVK
jgi:hypothetical protein|tara:strand:- start:2135 stop:2764 length:630 start_codon:yes stop_codon:yes gene_type:complete